MADYAKLAEAAREAVIEASGVCREVQSKLDDIRAITKDDKSPVTVADFASQAIVVHMLRQKLGDFCLLGEEDPATLADPSNATQLEACLAAVRDVWPECSAEDLIDAIGHGNVDMDSPGFDRNGFWTLDPIDGTKGFLRGQQYAVSLGYIERGEPVVGALGCPNLARDFAAPLTEPDRSGSVYTVIKGGGVEERDCMAEDVAGSRETIQRLPHEEGSAVSVCGSVEKAHSSHSDTDRILEHLQSKGYSIADPARLDSQAKYAVVARGQADAYLRLPVKKGYVERIWDHAAGSLVATESGCFVTDIHGKPLDFSHGAGLETNQGVICAPAGLHGDIIGAIKDLGIGPA